MKKIGNNEKIHSYIIITSLLHIITKQVHG